MSFISPRPAQAQDTATKPYDLLPYDVGRQLPGVPTQRPPGTGIEEGSYLVLPRLDLTEEYNSNIYATTQDVKPDFVHVINPAIDAYSRLTESALNFHGNVTEGVYTTHASEDYTEYQFGTDGYADIRSNSRFFFATYVGRSHIDRGSPDDARGLQPTFLDTRRAEARLEQSFGRFKAEIGFSAENYEYENVPIVGGFINLDHQDRTSYNWSVKVGYELVPNEYSVFVRGGYLITDYRLLTIDNKNLDSNTYSLVLGTEARLVRLLTGEAYVGFLHQQYGTSAFKSYSGPTFGVTLTWAPTLLTVVRLSADRTIEDTDFNSQSGYFQNAIAVAVDHELRHSVMLHAGFFYADRSYRGIFSNEQVYQETLGARYEVNRYLYIGPVISYTQRHSNILENNYSQFLGAIRLTGQL
jgi:hypothetical protein